MSTRVPAHATPALIEWARRKAGFSRDVIARKLKVNESLIEQWESGARKPTIKQLRRFGEAVHRPLAFFYLPSPPQDFDAIRDFRHVADVEPGSESPELLLAIRSAHTNRSLALDLMEDLGETPDTNIPTAGLGDDPESLGSTIRTDLGCETQIQSRWSSFYAALNFWRSAVEGKGILVMQFGDVNRIEARGFSMADFPLPIIAVNRAEWPQARIFSIIHELVHLMLRQGGLCNFIEHNGGVAQDEQLEVFSNRVAGAALVPRDDLLSDPIMNSQRPGRDFEEQDIVALSRRFRVSREVILRRLLIFDIVTRQFYESKRSQYERELEQTRGPSEGFAPPHALALSTAGPLFTGLVIRSYQQHRITAADVAEYLNLRLKHLPRVQDSLLALMSS